MAKTAREILEEFYTNYREGLTEATCGLAIDQALSDLYDLLKDGVKDKRHKTVSMMEFNPDVANQIEGFNQANTAWRKHLQERLR